MTAVLRSETSSGPGWSITHQEDNSLLVTLSSQDETAFTGMITDMTRWTVPSLWSGYLQEELCTADLDVWVFKYGA